MENIPGNPMDIIGYSQLQLSTNTVFAAHHNQHYFSIIVNGMNIHIIDSLAEDCFNLQQYISDVLPNNYNVIYTALNIQEIVGVNSCGHITLSVLQYLNSNPFNIEQLLDARGEIVTIAKEIFMKSTSQLEHEPVTHQDDEGLGLLPYFNTLFLFGFALISSTMFDFEDVL